MQMRHVKTVTGRFGTKLLWPLDVLSPRRFGPRRFRPSRFGTKSALTFWHLIFLDVLAPV